MVSRCNWTRWTRIRQGLDDLRSTQLNGSRVVYETPTFIGCVVALSRRLYVRLHGFDTDMLSWGSEDVDLGCSLGYWDTLSSTIQCLWSVTGFRRALTRTRYRRDTRWPIS